MYSVLFLALLSFLCCYALTPVVSGWSRRHGYVDLPDARRRHVVPTPRTGGIAIAISYVAPLGILLVLPLSAADAVNLPSVVSLLPSALVVFGIGLLDDLVGLKPWQKLIGQVVAACMAYAAGVHVSGAAGYVAPGWLSLPLTVLWLVACTNAFNLIDGVDGLASGVGLLAAFATLTAALLQNNAALALATAPLVGALLAFLRYNFAPASIFMGDCGSLTLGFVLGCFGAIWSQKSATLLGLTAPLMALSIPLLDTGLSVIRRFLRRQPIFKGDRNHIHHRLLDRGLSSRQVALVLYGLCGLAAAFSLLQATPGHRFGGLLLVMFCIALSIGVRLVGYAEFDTVRQLVQAGTFREILDAKLTVETTRRKIAAAVHPEDYWLVVQDVGRSYGCNHVRLSLAGCVFEERSETDHATPDCAIRARLGVDGYVNFSYSGGPSARRAVALGLVADVLQQSVKAQSAEVTAFRSSSPRSYGTAGESASPRQSRAVGTT